MTETNELEAEERLFAQHRAEWLSSGLAGSWAAIQGDQILGPFGSFGAAYEAGLKQFGPVTFLVKEIRAEGDVDVVHRVMLK